MNDWKTGENWVNSYNRFVSQKVEKIVIPLEDGVMERGSHKSFSTKPLEQITRLLELVVSDEMRYLLGDVDITVGNTLIVSGMECRSGRIDLTNSLTLMPGQIVKLTGVAYNHMIFDAHIIAAVIK